MSNSNKCELISIFKDIYHINNYEDILKDNSIEGKFKYIFNYRPDSNNCPGNILLHYLMQYSSDENTIFSYSAHRSWRTRSNEQSCNKCPSRIVSTRLPHIPYKNLKCDYKGVSLWLSNIATSQYLTEQNPSHPPCMMVISVDSNLKSHKEFIDTHFMENLIRNAKIWHMTNIIGEPYVESEFFEVFTYNDGYWDLKKGNRIRTKETLFLEESFYDTLITKINKFSMNKTKEIYRRLNVPYKLNILLHGPPGTGKTSFIEVMASELKRNIRFMQITPKITDEQFSSAISSLGDKDILVCEDIDCLFIDRKKSDSDKNSMTFSGLLNCFDGINGGKNGLIVFMTTNYKCRLDNALTRPGRVDILEEFKYMSKKSLSKMVKFYFEDHYDQKDFDKLYDHFKDSNITGAIMSKFLLSLLLDDTYSLYKNRKHLQDILQENDYESQSAIEKNLYM